MPVHHRLRLLAFPVRARGGKPPLVRHEISRFPHKERLHMPGSPTALGRVGTRSSVPVHIAFRQQNGVGTQEDVDFAAQWLAYALPCRRFAGALADACARLGADVVCYAFIAVDLHHLLLAGLPAHSALDPLLPSQVRYLVSAAFCPPEQALKADSSYSKFLNYRAQLKL
jgi:hypothetical protein